jgi:hypothetical protein
MTWWRRVAALALVSAALAGGARTVSAQEITIRAVPTTSDSISPAPEIQVQGTPVPVGLQPSTVTLELSREALFRAPFLVRSAPGIAASFIVDSLLPEHAKIYFRARVIDAFGVVREQKIDSFPVRSWLRLVEPVAASNNVVFTNKPHFVWSSPAITLPPGLWQYEITVINTRTGIPFQGPNLTSDTSYVFPNPLDACTSYKWLVTARATHGGPNDQVTINAPGTFVIQSPECPSLTLFYQNFPNPFGRGGLSESTCFWFDLVHRTTVTLTIYDIRLHEVRRIVPSRTPGGLTAQLDSGAYGRQLNSQSGCDPRLAWDGTDDRRRFVPPGVYIAVFTADGVRSSKKILYKGP